jgi:DNA-binding XRE family transcriptional regulator
MSAGFVYLFRADNGLLKIGRSGSPRDRLKAFACLPVAVELIHQIRTNDMEWLEGELHQLYAARHVRGEWFRLTEEEVEVLKAKDEVVNAPDRAADTTGENLGATLAESVRRLRQRAGFSQQMLANVANLSVGLISKIEQGFVKDPLYSTLRAVAGALGVKVKDLTGEG